VPGARPPGAIDAIAAGHTHQGVAQRVAGIPIVQAFANGRAFGRIDLSIDRRRGRVVASRIFPPRALCGAAGGLVPSFAPDACQPPPYEGQPVRFDPRIAALLAPEVARARGKRDEPVGVTLRAPIRRVLRAESPLGNLVADLLRAAEPAADLAFINGGSLRADLPAGRLRYGQLYEALPFDDGLATVKLDGGKLRALLARNLGGASGIVSLSGVRATARCQDGDLVVALHDQAGREIPAGRPLLAVTSGYLASGGDGLLQGIATGEDPRPVPMREIFVRLLAARGGELGGYDPALYDPRHPRLAYPGDRPLRCPPR
jgi:2',3'-cyclic-nucleotide 2'-phosphodiesterase (5'-nucleotidase family)